MSNEREQSAPRQYRGRHRGGGSSGPGSVPYAEFEARERIGSRAWTETQGLGIAFNCGYALLHSAGRNPLRVLAERYDLPSVKDTRQRFHLGWRFVSKKEHEANKTFIRHNLYAVSVASLLGQDMSASHLLDPNHPRTTVVVYLVAAINGVDPVDYFTGDADTEDDTGEEWLVRGGLGALVAIASAGAHVKAAFAVRTIHWNQLPVRIDSECGLIRANTVTVIVAVPVSVLAAGGPRFQPALPIWKRNALGATIPMGQSEKIALHFDSGLFVTWRNTYLTALEQQGHLDCTSSPLGEPMVITYVRGRLARELESLTGSEAVGTVLDRLRGIFGISLANHVRVTTLTCWYGERWTRGGYFATRPGQTHRRRGLTTSLHHSIHFSVEATLQDAFATVHGAWLSGYNAAHRVAMQLGASR